MGEPLNQVQKEILKNYEHIQTYQGLEHHHRRGQVSRHGPDPGGQEEVNLVISFKKSTPQILFNAWSMHIMVEKSILDNILIKILFLSPQTCAVGPGVVLGKPE